MESETKKLKNWVAIAGRWEFKDDSAKYLGPDPEAPIRHGIALSDARVRRGSIMTQVRFLENAKESEGRIIFGYNAKTTEYFLTGIGGYRFAFVLDQFIPARGWFPFAAVGSSENFTPNANFQIEAKLFGQRASLIVDGIKVIERNLPTPLGSDQVGLFAVGPGPVEFTSTQVTADSPKAFVVMQFGEPYDALYTDVIQPVVNEKKLEAFRADDVYKPGIILQDIISSITESEIIIAEITPPNPNVFYELGYSHAMKKSTILLAERGKPLPFDVSGFRVIFYDNTIKGKKDVEENLRRHLASVLQDI
ncbi:MAG: hypothetical protein HY868_20835 [Chloroflexi bacterium]|nr:hypothetical protein [Chloroflexota bacterium]